MSDKIETAEYVDPEINPEHADHEIAIKDEIMEADVMDNIIAASKKMEAFDKAFSSIMNVVMKRTYAGDWVSMAKAKDPIHLRSASLSGAGCDRVATILGISEKNWKEHPKLMGDDGKSYTFRYEADFTWGGLTRHAYGESSTRNKFFGYENGAWKELSEVREDYIRKSAQRECQKDGIRRLLGLRKIPITKLGELGFNINLVHFVNFNSASEAVGDQAIEPTKQEKKEAATATPPQEMSMTLKAVLGRKWKDNDIIDCLGTKGEKLSWWGKKNTSPEGIDLQRFAVEGWMVTFKYTQKGDYRNIVEIVEAVPQ